MSRKSIAPESRQAGFTLVEFLVALIIGMLVVLAAIATMLGTRSTAMTGDDVNALNQSSALAFRLLGQQIRQAGYIPIDATEPLYYFSVSPGKGTNLTGEPAFFAIRGVESPGGAENDRLKLGYAPNPDYFKDCLGQEPGRASGGGYDAADPAASGNARLITSEFSVDNKGVLRCRGSGNATPQPVIDGVERFDVMYGVNARAGSQQVVRYVTADDVADFNSVRTVRICLQLVGTSKSNPGGSHTDCNGESRTGSDGRLRRVYTAVFSLRNDLGAL
ncbi:prepilin-type N-terminal cleavage/methylation domain-containing protein [Variovorax gossypii]|uniref:Prepilin-type N-terminal cleavage/methylation domain-containing protein n=1 Tax=Variovorax gossypii TaxID=1679495 RepID=A0A431TPY1_9BURK|nr:PilW family protein [Variovorax gossypii]RTQ36231.1 prepilin-type N-terminal cleavage/methylation domain-containing protein [Variovorax gossypii]